MTRGGAVTVVLLVLAACGALAVRQFAAGTGHTYSAGLEEETDRPTVQAAGNTMNALPNKSHWPAGSWRTSTPEEQGIESGLLLQMLAAIREHQYQVHSVLVVRKGHLVAEAYSAPYGPDTRHGVYSVTKSVTSAAAGAALAQGLIGGTDERVADLAPDLLPARAGPRKREITIEHLLTMTTGLAWRETSTPLSSRSNSLARMVQSDDWARFVLDQPMAGPPGARFSYNSGAAHLLSAVLQRRIGQTVAAFAEEHLLRPLGISNFRWLTDPQGASIGAWGLELTPRDMAKLGYLYLEKGSWEGLEVLPAQWIEQTLKAHVKVAADPVPLWTRLTQLWSPESRATAGEEYGYLWWVSSAGGFAARGRAGQAIFVLPHLDLVVVFTGGLSPAASLLPERLMQQFIIPAVKSPEPLPPDPAAIDSLNSMIREMAEGESGPAPPLPETAGAVSGKAYLLERNRAGMGSISLTFAEGNEALLKVVQGDSAIEYLVGLDNAYRTTGIGNQETAALRGHWSDERTFVIDWALLGAGERITAKLTFEGDRITFASEGTIDRNPLKLRGRREVS